MRKVRFAPLALQAHMHFFDAQPRRVAFFSRQHRMRSTARRIELAIEKARQRRTIRECIRVERIASVVSGVRVIHAKKEDSHANHAFVIIEECGVFDLRRAS